MKRILITGAAGNLGRKLAIHLQGRYDLQLLDMKTGDYDDVKVADLAQWDPAWVQHFAGVDTVVHLAANPNPMPAWAELLESNMDTVVNVFNAAAQQGVQRVIYASSNHAMGQYKDIPEPATLTTTIPPRPGTRVVHGGEELTTLPYGAMKLLGERVGKSFADAYGMTVIAVRIGWVLGGANQASAIAAEREDWYRLMWLSNRDFCQLMERGIEADLGTTRFAVVNGMSNNTGMRWDLRYTKQLLGYAPQDDVTLS
ncbi:MAG: NAD(P)-dependent oxidoreductase [Caldilineaceae bacterium]|nr:NAD(P)-dependent oxidoreductase [Caldilineaceae bacterium]